MVKVRGTTFLGTLDFVRQSYGEEALARTLAALSESTRSCFGENGRALLPGVWYEASALSELTRTIDSLLGSGDLALARAAGKYVAFTDVNRFFKWLFRLTGPNVVFARAGAVWNNYYDQGTYVFEGSQAGRASIRIEGWHAADEILCKRLEGWIERAFELTIGDTPRPVIVETHHQATAPGETRGPFCRFEARWDA
jgi:hypothetical protein